MTDPLTLAQAVLRGETRAAARLITLIERDAAGLGPALDMLHRRGGGARVIGVTGPPGAGKSTLVDAMIRDWRDQGRRVAVLAVDPSSPFGGGAVLGDRVRMQRHATDPAVFVRSMSARGSTGGLARAAAAALAVLEALGVDIVLVETVGVGQTEVEVAALCPCVLLLQTSAGGDMVQAIKAGIMEVGSVLVVGKPTLGDADRTARQLREAVELNPRSAGGWRPPVVIADALTGRGMEDLRTSIDARFDWLAAHPEIADAEAAGRALAMARTAALAALAHDLRMLGADDPALADLAARVAARQANPAELRDRLIAAIALRFRTGPSSSP
ncbi:MAG: methylmalonyl Co-A mutase-associated GTPase MeaB [Sagittula sp.]|uniref:methylmalonyl Co-A mutase-associated GTPase MeaB n=1 Tax=Sagittula sp. TaxID=2038081 RepID=UPI004058CBB0